MGQFAPLLQLYRLGVCPFGFAIVAAGCHSCRQSGARPCIRCAVEVECTSDLPLPKLPSAAVACNAIPHSYAQPVPCRVTSTLMVSGNHQAISYSCFSQRCHFVSSSLRCVRTAILLRQGWARLAGGLCIQVGGYCPRAVLLACHTTWLSADIYVDVCTARGPGGQARALLAHVSLQGARD